MMSPMQKDFVSDVRGIHARDSLPNVEKVSMRTASSTSSPMPPTKTVFLVLVPSSISTVHREARACSLDPCSHSLSHASRRSSLRSLSDCSVTLILSSLHHIHRHRYFQRIAVALIEKTVSGSVPLYPHRSRNMPAKITGRPRRVRREASAAHSVRSHTQSGSVDVEVVSQLFS